MLDLFLDFESRALAVLPLKMCGRKAIISRAQIQNIPNFGRENQNIIWQSRNIPNFSRESRNLGRAQSQNIPNFGRENQIIGRKIKT